MGTVSPILTPQVVLVEDILDDGETTMRASRRAGIAHDVFRCGDGNETLDYVAFQGSTKLFNETPSSPVDTQTRENNASGITNPHAGRRCFTLGERKTR